MHPNSPAGPLHWHNGVEIKLSADELKAILISEGFIVHEWELVAGEAYRNDVDVDSSGASGAATLPVCMTDELYNVIRFCVSLDDSKDFDSDESIIDRLEKGRKLIKTREQLNLKVEPNKDEDHSSSLFIEEL